MNDIYFNFQNAIAQSSQNAAIIFAGTVLALLSYKAIDWFPQRWKISARLVAWSWVITFLAGTVVWTMR